MYLCESSLQRAVETFLREAGIPRPEGWTPRKDEVFLHNRVYPAFLKALEEIEAVHLCHGFAIENIGKGQ